MHHPAVKAGAFAIAVLIGIAVTARQSPESVVDIPYLGPIVVGAVGLVILGIGATVYLALSAGQRRLKRMTHPYRSRKKTSRRRRWWH